MTRNTQQSDSNEYGKPTLILAAKGKAGDIPKCRAIKDLNHKHPDVFPIRKDDGGWITALEADSYNGQWFVSNRVEILTDQEECPECGNDRHLKDQWQNGVVGGMTEICTVCDHEFYQFCG